jgi:uncharacterized protein (DUF779 family)
MTEGFSLSNEIMERLKITPAAQELIRELQARFGELMFHQSGGCCDGSQPMCFEKGDFKTGEQDVCLGTIEDCEFWMSADQFTYWQYCELTLDVVEGRGSSFSLEIPFGKRFHIRSRLFSEEELKSVKP